MKTNRILSALASLTVTAATFLAVGGLCYPAVAHADSSDAQGLGTWEGTGMTSEIGGKDLGAFTITLTRTAVSPGTVRSDGKVHTADGKNIVFWQEKTDRGAGNFSITSSLGSGGGSCFVNGMCQSLEKRADGVAFASTVAADGPAKVRVLVTELKDGHAVRFYAQTLVKKP